MLSKSIFIVMPSVVDADCGIVIIMLSVVVAECGIYIVMSNVILNECGIFIVRLGVNLHCVVISENLGGHLYLHLFNNLEILN